MRSYILVGDSEKRNEFLSDYIRKEAISKYAITRYSDNMGIKEARLFRLSLSKKYNDKHLFVIESKMTIGAQNALLKSFEEIPDSISIIISASHADDILDTIKSRFFEIKVGMAAEKMLTTNLDIKKTLAGNVKDKILLIDEFISKNKDIASSLLIDDFILSYRNALLANLETIQKENLAENLRILKNLIRVAPFIKSNNLNLRLGLESSLLQDSIKL